MKFFHGQFSCVVGYKAAELLPHRSQNWGVKSPQKFPIAGTRQQRQGGSSRGELCILPRSRTGWAAPGTCNVVEPTAQELCWCMGSNARQLTPVRNTASCPWELLLRCVQFGSSECHSATPGRLCPEPRNAKQMSAAGIFPGLGRGCVYSTQLL